MMIAVVLLAFSVPKAYELKKDEVDDVLNSVQKQSSSIYKQYAEPYVQKIPRYALLATTFPRGGRGGGVARALKSNHTFLKGMRYQNSTRLC